MKKYIILGLGLFFLGGAVVSFSEASRDAYHAYLYQQAKVRRVAGQYQRDDAYQRPIRHFAERQGDFNRATVGQKTSDKNVGTAQLLPNYRYPTYGKRNFYSPRNAAEHEDVVQHAVRGSTNRMGPFQYKRSTRLPMIQFKNTQKEVARDLATFTNNTFSLQIPASFDEKNMEAEKIVFASTDEQVRLEVRHVEEGCTNVSFDTCAVALSKDMNHKTLDAKSPAEKINVTHQVVRQSGQGGVAADGSMTNTFMEGFGGQIKNQDLYFSRFFVEGLAGDVYVLEVQAPRTKMYKYLETIKKIFDSFRIIG